MLYVVEEDEVEVDVAPVVRMDVELALVDDGFWPEDDEDVARGRAALHPRRRGGTGGYVDVVEEKVENAVAELDVVGDHVRLRWMALVD